MLFSSFSFLFGFAPLAIAAILIAGRLSRSAFQSALVVASLVFYGSFRWDYTLILVGSAIVNYAIAGHIGQGRNRPLFIAGLVFNVALLGAFKYADFALANVAYLTAVDLPLPGIALPLAISFITFEQIAFLSDVHQSRIARGTALEYAAFITFFPKLIAGPIIRYSELAPQLRAGARWQPDLVLAGLCVFCVGLFKKVVLADTFTSITDPAFNAIAEGAMLSPADAIGATVAFGFRIYFDFSAYSEMAIGLALIMGLRLPVNFMSPYKATSIIDFWRTWHITLSAFLRDYIYIPLGGNRHGKLRRYLNLTVVMLVGGLWHGAAWTFVVWGAIHGMALAINHLFRDAKLRLPKPVGWALTMTVVMAAWVFFRAPNFSSAWRTFASLTSKAPPQFMTMDAVVWLLIGLVIVTALPNVPEIFGFPEDRERIDWSARPSAALPRLPMVTASAALLAVSLVWMAAGEINAFIYFQF